MKSIFRCTANYQGDRCKKARHHASSVYENPDLVHVGNFSVWDTEGRAPVYVKVAAPRSRRMNRVYRMLFSKGSMEYIDWRIRKPLLEMVAQYFKGRA